MNRVTNRLWVMAAAMALCMGGTAMAQDTGNGRRPAQPATPAQPAQPKAEGKGAVGTVAPNFTLRDLEGKEVSLNTLTTSGQVVVLMWFNPDCPFVRKHFVDGASTFNQLAESYRARGVTLLAINSGAPGEQGAGIDRNKKARDDWKINFPVLLDESGDVGRAYDARRTPEMVIVGKDGKVLYRGAIDDDSGADKPGSTNYVSKALDEILAGQTVTTPETRAYGCTVKYKRN